VPYKGASPAITDLLGGHVQLAALSVASGTPNIKAGKVRGLAVTSPKRSAALPDVPTVAESAFPASTRPAGSASSCPTARHRR
jgi:tripartite-type tricarboxylate transporter receptor subunit TctC